jgi:hypothetical protein
LPIHRNLIDRGGKPVAEIIAVDRRAHRLPSEPAVIDRTSSLSVPGVSKKVN